LENIVSLKHCIVKKTGIAHPYWTLGSFMFLAKRKMDVLWPNNPDLRIVQLAGLVAFK